MVRGCCQRRLKKKLQEFYSPNQARDKDGKFTDEGERSGHPDTELKEDTGGDPPKIGEPFLVYRLGRRGALENDNAGNALGVASHLASIDDPEGPQPIGGTGDKIMAFRVTPLQEWGSYEPFNVGSGEGFFKESNTIGRVYINGVVSYSFPKDGKFTYEKVAEVTLADVRKILKKQHGDDSFDYVGALAGAEAIRKAFATQKFDQQSGKTQDRDKSGKYTREGKVDTSAKSSKVTGDAKDTEGRIPERSFIVNSDTDREAFAAAIKRTHDEHPFGKAVEVKDSSFYRDKANTLYLSDDKLAGSAVTSDGDIVSGFKHPSSTADFGAIFHEAANKGTHLDAFTSGGGHLPELYAKEGFRPVVRVPFNKDYAPKDWPYDKIGEPDVVLMVKDRDNKLGLPDINANGYKAVEDSIPVEKDYDKAHALQEQAIKKVNETTETKPDTVSTVPTGAARWTEKQVSAEMQKHFDSFVKTGKYEETHSERAAFDDLVKRSGWTEQEIFSLSDKEFNEAIKPHLDKIKDDEDDEDYGLSSGELDMLKDFKDRQKAFTVATGKLGLRYDADLTGERIPEKAVTDYLDAIGDMQVKNLVARGMTDKVKYGGPQDFIRSEGYDFDVPDKPPQIELMTPKNCYGNATITMLRDPTKYDYVEGYYMSNHVPFPIEHAWVVDKETHTVVDPTLGWQPTGRYVGVIFPKPFVMKKMRQNKYYGIMSNGVTVTDVVLGIDKDFKYGKRD